MRRWWWSTPNWARFLLVFPAVLALTGVIGGVSGVLLPPPAPPPLASAAVPGSTTAAPLATAPVTTVPSSTRPTTTKPPAKPKVGVLGALCPALGAAGVTKARKPLLCARSTDGKARWRAA